MILAFLAIACLLGVAAAAFTGADTAASLAAAGLFGVISFGLRPRWTTLALIGAGVVLIFAAGWRYDSTTPQPSPIGRFNDGDPVRLHAVITDEPDDRASSRLYRLNVQESFSDGLWRPDSGGVLMRASIFPKYEYGDLIEVRGKLETPPAFDDFDYRDYLFRRGVDSVASYPKVRVLDHGQGNPLRSTLIDIRTSLTDALSGVLPDPEATLATGILFGARSHIPRDLNDDMQATGTSHLVAVSGQNVVLVAAFVIGALAWAVGRRRAAWTALVAVVLYALLVGGQPSVVRAAIMGSLYVLAIALGRQNTAAITIALAAAVMTALDPQIVHDVSFQLSFAATVGLIALTPHLTAAFQQVVARAPSVADFPATRMLLDVATMTLAATAFTLPIIAINFHRVSVTAPLANLFAIPAFVAVAATSALAAVLALILPVDASFLSWLAWPPAAYLIAVIRLFAGLPIASIDIRGVHLQHAIAYYAVLAAAVLWFSRHPLQQVERPAPPPRPRVPRLLPAGGLALLLALSSGVLWLAISAPAHGRLTVTFLDVGQGEAILIESPEGHRILVDGGPSGEAITPALGRHLPFYDRRLDLVTLTHPQLDHIGGLPTVIDEYAVGRVLTSPAQVDSAAYRAWSDALRLNNVPLVPAERGQAIDLGDGARLGVLSADRAGDTASLNDSSLVLRLTMGDISFLLTGDITAEGESALVHSGANLDTTVLKIPHHGSLTSTSPGFVARTSPLVDVISVGANNRYGHPTDAVLARLAGDLVLRTDQHGDITLSTDGENLWLETQRDLPPASAVR
jgi:competence protein ComEC